MRTTIGYEVIITLSLFDGISCGMLSLKRAGIYVDKYYASEINQKSIMIANSNYSDIIHLGDVASWKTWDIDWGSVDLLIGGSPCQGFSNNGKKLNFEDPRSKLFFVYVDILNKIRESNPNVKFLLENVKMKKEWVMTISEHLGVDAVEINSKLLSAQHRVRMYWFNWDADYPVDKGIVLTDILDEVDTSDYIMDGGLLFDSRIPESGRKLISNVNGEIRIRQATKQGYIVVQDGDGINLSFPTSKTRRGRVIKQASPTLDCSCNVCVLHNGAIRYLTVNELERLQTLPVGYTRLVGAVVAKKAIGDGWNVDTVVHLLRGLITDTF